MLFVHGLLKKFNRLFLFYKSVVLLNVDETEDASLRAKRSNLLTSRDCFASLAMTKGPHHTFETTAKASLTLGMGF